MRIAAESKTELMETPEFHISRATFQKLLFKICDGQTSKTPDGWSKENPLYGHCAIVALVAQNLYGGKLLRAPFPEDYPALAFLGSHYANKLPSGEIIDFTAPQFEGSYPKNLKFEERDRNYVLGFKDTQARYQILAFRVAKAVTKNSLFNDPIYERCFKTALLSPCQKMQFGAVMVRNGEIVAESCNKTIEELKSMCEPTCIRLKIASRTQSMLGACGHAEEWALKEIRDRQIDPKECDIYIAGVKMNGMPWIKDRPEHTCLRCAVQMHFAQIKTIFVPSKDQWIGINTSQALETAKLYAMGELTIPHR